MIKCLTLIGISLIILASTAASVVYAPQPIDPPQAPNWKRATYEQLADEYAKLYKIPKQVFRNLIQTESSWDRYAISHRNALGLTQITPITARHFGVAWETLSDPVVSIRTGAKILASYIRICGSLRLGLMAYNAGPSVCRYADSILVRR